MTDIFRYADEISNLDDRPKLLNFTNVKNCFELKLKSGKFLSESYVLKGHGPKLEEKFKPKT